MAFYWQLLKYRFSASGIRSEYCFAVVLLGLLLLLGVPKVSGQVDPLPVDLDPSKPLITPKGVFLTPQRQAQQVEFNAQVYRIRLQVAQQVQQLEQQGKLEPDSTFAVIASRLEHAVPVTNQQLLLDNQPGEPSVRCNGIEYSCVKLPDGPILFYPTQRTLSNGGGLMRALLFGIDPDGKYSDATDNWGQSLVSFIYPSGQLTTLGTEPLMQLSGHVPDPEYWDPSRFDQAS